MPYEVEFPDGTVIEGIPDGTPMEAVAARYEQETGNKAPPRSQPQGPQAPEPGFIERTYDTARQGISDAFSTIAGDTYGQGGDPTARREEGVLGKTASVLGSDLIPAAGEIAGDAFISAGKAVLPASGERAVAEAVGDVTQAITDQPAVQAAMGHWDNFAQSHPDAARRVGQAANIASVALPIPKAPKTSLGKAAQKKLGPQLKKDRRTLASRLLQPDADADTALRTEVEPGPLGLKKYNPTQWENEVIDEAVKVPGFKPAKSYSDNVQPLNQELNRRRIDLDRRIGDATVPIADVRNKIIRAVNEVGKKPTLVGGADEAAVRIYRLFDEEISKLGKKKEIKATDLLQLRRDFDQQMQDFKPTIFDTTSNNAFKVANTELRNTLNELVDKAAPQAGVKQDLLNQSKLYEARDTIARRAADEAASKMGRIINDLERSSGLSLPKSPLGGAATARSVPAAALAGGVAGALTLKRIASGYGKSTLIKALHEVDRLIDKGGATAQRLKADRAALVALIAEAPEEGSEQQ